MPATETPVAATEPKPVASETAVPESEAPAPVKDEKPQKPDKTDKTDKPDKPDKPNKAVKPTKKQTPKVGTARTDAKAKGAASKTNAVASQKPTATSTAQPPKAGKKEQATPPTSLIAQAISAARTRLGVTQDEFGRKFEISGPAVFKLEKGFVRPSYELWVRIATEAVGMTPDRAKLMLMRERMPLEDQHLIQIGPSKVANTGDAADYSTVGRENLQVVVAADKDLPLGLREIIADDEVWSMYKPTGAEINALRDTFPQFGIGNKVLFGEALRLMREFSREF